MSYVRNNPSPCCVLEPDCVVRAVALATGKSWDRVYTELSLKGFEMCSPFVVNKVWGAYLSDNGYKSFDIARACTVREFAEEHPRGIYILGTGTHAVAVIDGKYHDAWDSGDEQVRYFFVLEE